jgi:hypothetical protein
MTTSIGVIATVTLLVAGVFLLRSSALAGHRLPRSGLLILIGVIICFFVWMAIMVFLVGPSMRTI